MRQTQTEQGAPPRKEYKIDTTVSADPRTLAGQEEEPDASYQSDIVLGPSVCTIRTHLFNMTSKQCRRLKGQETLRESLWTHGLSS